MFKSILSLLLLVFVLEAKDLKEPALIFQKKCQMCHNLNAPNSVQERDAMVAPYIRLSLKSVTVGIDAVEEPKNNEELRELAIEHIKDYIFNPTKDKSYCEEVIFEKFRYMPSLKRFISQEEANIVAPWIYDNFAPKKYRVAK